MRRKSVPNAVISVVPKCSAIDDADGPWLGPNGAPDAELFGVRRLAMQLVSEGAGDRARVALSRQIVRIGLDQSLWVTANQPSIGIAWMMPPKAYASLPFACADERLGHR